MSYLEPNHQVALQLINQERYTDADGLLGRLLASDPENSMSLAISAWSRSEQGDHARAIELAKLAIAKDPGDAFLLTILSRVLAGARKIKEAIAAVEEAVEIDPLSEEAWSWLAALRATKHDWRATLQATQECLAINPTNDACLNLQAMAQTHLGDLDQAGRTMEGALDENPNDAFTHANQGWTLLHRRDYEGAGRHFREALRLDPECEWAREGALEALRARNAFYRVFLRLKLKMDGMTPRRAAISVFGAYFLYLAVIKIAPKLPILGPLLWVLVGIYLSYVLLSWFAEPIANALLLLNPFGRLALKPREKALGIVVTPWLVGSVALALIGWAQGNSELRSIGLWALIFTVPLSLTIPIEKRGVRRGMIAFCLATALIGTIGLYKIIHHDRQGAEIRALAQRASDARGAMDRLSSDDREALLLALGANGEDPAEELRPELITIRDELHELAMTLGEQSIQERGDALEKESRSIDFFVTGFPLLCVFGSQFVLVFLTVRFRE